MNIRDATHVKVGDMLVRKHIYANEYRSPYSPSREPFEVAEIEFCGDDIIFVSKSGYKWKHNDVERYNPV